MNYEEFLQMMMDVPEFQELVKAAQGCTEEQIRVAVDFLNDRKAVKYLPVADVDADIKADFVVLVNGDSMIGARIHDGDLVFIQQQSEVENGDIAAVVIGDNEEITLTRFYRYGDMVILHPENPIYQETVCTGTDSNSIHILGKAVAFQSKLSRK